FESTDQSEYLLRLVQSAKSVNSDDSTIMDENKENSKVDIKIEKNNKKLDEVVDKEKILEDKIKLKEKQILEKRGSSPKFPIDHVKTYSEVSRKGGGNYIHGGVLFWDAKKENVKGIVKKIQAGIEKQK